MSKGSLTKVEAQTERMLMIGLITSKTFCNRLAHIIPRDLFDQNWMNKLIAWSTEYFRKIDEPICENLQDVFNKRSRRLQEEERELATIFLQELSESYDAGQNFNTEYWIGECTNLIKTRIMEKQIEEAQAALKRGDVRDAEYAMQSYTPVSEAATNGFVLSDVDRMLDSLYNPELDTTLLELEGDFGAFLGTIYKEDLVGILSNSKGGKTFAANHLAHQAARHGLNTLYISHEMSERECHIRNIEYVTKQTYLGKYHETATYTDFDCKKNQAGKCSDKRYAGRGIPLKDPKDADHMPCTACANDRSGKYEPTLWVRDVTKPKLTEEAARKKLNSEFKFYGDNLYIEPFSPNTANYKDIENLLQMYAAKGIIMDVVIDDYINIHKGVGNEWDKISQEWLECKKIARDYKVAYISPVHKKGSLHNVEARGSSSLAGSTDVYKHVNKLFEMNTTDKECEYNVVRVNHVGGRIGRASPADTCLISQVREHGHVVWDSLWLKKATVFEELQEEKKEEKKEKKRTGFRR